MRCWKSISQIFLKLIYAQDCVLGGCIVDEWVSLLLTGRNEGLLYISYHTYAVHSAGIMCVQYEKYTLFCIAYCEKTNLYKDHFKLLVNLDLKESFVTIQGHFLI
jgi:hypothetical protein